MVLWFFDGRISTNGTDVSIYFKHPNAPVYGGECHHRSKEELRVEVEALYMENNMQELRRAKNVVVIDPNKRDTLFMQDMNNNSVLRYTSNQRAVESGSRLYDKKRKELRRPEWMGQYESLIPSHKTMNSRFIVVLSSSKRELNRDLHVLKSSVAESPKV